LAEQKTTLSLPNHCNQTRHNAHIETMLPIIYAREGSIISVYFVNTRLYAVSLYHMKFNGD